MVLLTITPSLVDGLKSLDEERGTAVKSKSKDGESDLASLAVGKPIAHNQVLDIARWLKASGKSEYRLEDLLLGSKVYIAPPAPKPEQTPEYKALMERLRRDEENRAYERMISPPGLEKFGQRFPNPSWRGQGSMSAAHAFAEINRPRREDEGADEISFKEINRQLTVVFNVLVSIFGVATTVWFATQWRPSGERVLLCLLAAIVTAIADAVIYSGVLVDLSEPPKPIKDKPEVKEVVNTWSIGIDGKEMPVGEKQEDQPTVRRRHKLAS